MPHGLLAGTLAAVLKASFMSCVARVAIAGAGIGGLTLAHALLQRGIECVVLERGAELAEVGAGITLWRNALSVLDSLGLGPELQRVAAEPPGGVMARARGGILKRMDTEQMDSKVVRPVMLTFHRRDLQRVLHDALPASTVRFASSVTGYRTEQGRVLALTDAGEVEADLLVGADGIHSRVRAQLLGEVAPRYAGYTCFRGVTSAPESVEAFGEFWGRGTRFGLVPIGGNRLYWFAVISGPPNVRVDDARAYLASRFADYAFGVPQIIDGTPSEAILHNDIIDRPPEKRWSGERVTLLGDSIHATTPNMGQGAAMAIESAIVLSRLLAAQSSLDEALDGYAEIRQPRTRWVTQSSWRVGSLAQANTWLTCALRDSLIRWMPASVQQRSLTKLLSYRAADVGG